MQVRKVDSTVMQLEGITTGTRTFLNVQKHDYLLSILFTLFATIDRPLHDRISNTRQKQSCATRFGLLTLSLISMQLLLLLT